VAFLRSLTDEKSAFAKCALRSSLTGRTNGMALATGSEQMITISGHGSGRRQALCEVLRIVYRRVAQACN